MAAAIEDDWASQCLALWRCIGCGAMGNAEDCLGTCDFKRDFVVDAAGHADLLEFFLNLGERNEALRRLAHDVVTATATADGFAAALAALRARAKILLAQPSLGAPPQAVPADERMEIWRCACCGQVEALRDCLGVCIRRNGDFVRAEIHDALSARMESATVEGRELTLLARQIAWTTPRPGQIERMRDALRTSALALPGAA